MTNGLVDCGGIRTSFSNALLALYRTEVPLCDALLSIVAEVNARIMAGHPDRAVEVSSADELDRLAVEPHFAIQIGTTTELATMRRAFAIMGMYPVGYYDLSVAGLPFHSTAFRPIDDAALKINSFCIFASLLRLELIDDEGLRAQAEAILSTRQIFTDEAIRLIELHEVQGGLGEGDADSFVLELLKSFRWDRDARVDAMTHDRLQDVHRLVAEITSMQGLRITHLIARTLDIDQARAAIQASGIGIHAVGKGPRRRQVPILLRHIGFDANERDQALPDVKQGRHSVQTVEIEQRGAALTPKGRALYDGLMATTCATCSQHRFANRPADAFLAFPDTLEAIREQGLAYFRYELTEEGRRIVRTGFRPNGDVDLWIAGGYVRARPIVYEDFLPAGVMEFSVSSVPGVAPHDNGGSALQAAFEAALGTAVHDELALYSAAEAQSIHSVRNALRPLPAIEVLTTNVVPISKNG